MNKKILYLMMFVLCVSLVSAVPKIPVQLYGDVAPGIVSGTLLEISINDLYETTTTLENNKVGVSNLVFLRKDDIDTVGIEGLQGNDEITLKFAGYEPINRTYNDSSLEIYYVNIAADELIEEPNCVKDSDCASNQECKNSDCVTKPGKTVNGGSGGGGKTRHRDTTLAPGFCISRWVCTGYGECLNGVQTRTCIKEMPCNDSSIKPPERVACGTVQSAATGTDNSFESQTTTTPVVKKDFDDSKMIIIEEEPKGISLPYVIFFLILLLILFGLAYLYYEHLMARKIMAQPYKENKTLDKYIKETLKKGFRKKDVQEALIKKGWDKDEVNAYFFHHTELQDGGVKILSNGQSNKKTPVSSLIRKKILANKRKAELHKGAKELVGEGSRIKVKKYIDMTLKKGFSKNDIKSALTKHGWKEPVVDKYLYEDIKKKKAVRSKAKSSKFVDKPLSEDIKKKKSIKPKSKLGKTTSSKVKSKNKNK